MINILNQKINKLMNEKPPAIAPIDTQYDRYPPASFDCKKVPNYRSSDNLPVPILNDFSNF